MTLFLSFIIFLLGGLLYLCRRNYIRLKRRVVPYRQQISLFQMREKFLNDIFNIKELSAVELQRLLKLKEKIIHKTQKLPDANRILFDELRFEPTEQIIKKALAERKWEKETRLLLSSSPSLAEGREFFAKAERLLSAPPRRSSAKELRLQLGHKTRAYLHSFLPHADASMMNTQSTYAHRFNCPKSKTLTQDENEISLPANSNHHPVISTSFSQLEKLQKRAQSVVFISPQPSRPFKIHEVGTGFIISPRLLLTTHEILPHTKSAQENRILFHYEDDAHDFPKAGKSVLLAPDRFFMTSKNQGFTLVALEEPLHDLPLLKPAGHLNFPPLKSALTAIHHAHGHPKQILHSPFALQEIIGHQFWFSGKPGLPMSGAPILNDRLEVIGLCQGSAQMNGEESSCSPCLHHQALRMDRIQHELKSSIHQLTRRDQAFLRDEHAITGFLLSTEG